MSKRKKLDTAIERNVHSFMKVVEEHVVDFTILRLRRSNVEVPGPILEAIMDSFRLAMEDGFQKNVDWFLQKISTELDEFTGESDPLLPSGT